MDPLVVFIHRGNPYYLKYSIAQAVETQRDARVVLLGDESNRGIEPGSWYPLASFGERAARFKRKYIHLSPHDVEFELFCVQRWLYLAEFLDMQGITGPVVHIDSDAMLYSSLRERLAGQEFELALTHEIGPAFTFFRRASLVQDFARFIENAYEPGPTFDILSRIYNEGVSPFWMKLKYVDDMHILGLFALTLNKTVDLSEPWNGQVFDYAFGLDEGYAYNPYKGIKIMKRIGKAFYATRGREKIRFSGLHFQVGAKVFLPQYYTGRRKFPDRYHHAYIKWRGRATTVAKWVLHKARLYQP
jgi:hypothetical protein